MSRNSSIEWCDDTWNPVTGCTEVSPGCDHCYAKTFAERWRGTEGHYFENGFDVQLRPDKLEQPLRWRKPRKVFVNSMSDLFHDQVPNEYIADVFAVMACAPRHTFQILTKRHARMRSLLTAKSVEQSRYRVSCSFRDLVDDSVGRQFNPEWAEFFQSDEWPLPNVWLGVSAEDQRWADIRIPALLDTPAAVRFVSAEPLLGPIKLEFEHYYEPNHSNCSGLVSPAHEPACGREPGRHWGIDWVITGGESGAGARPAHPDWFRSIRDQCQAAGVAYLHKQNGEWVEDVTEYPANPECGIDEPYRVLNVPRDAKDRNRCALHLAGMTALRPGNPFNPFERGHPGWTVMRRVGKKAAGRMLDGRTHDDYPQEV